MFSIFSIFFQPFKILGRSTFGTRFRAAYLQAAPGREALRSMGTAGMNFPPSQQQRLGHGGDPDGTAVTF